MAPTNPASDSSCCDASRDRGFQSDDSRPSYQDCESDQRLAAGMIAPIGVSVCADHKCTCSSDLKNRIVAHVKPMSSHHFAAGTREMHDAVRVRTSLPSSRDRRCGPRSPGRSWRSPRRRQRAVGMPNASHAQRRKPRSAAAFDRKRRRHARERQRHPRLARARIEDDRVRGVQALHRGAQFRFLQAAAACESVAERGMPPSANVL